MQIYTIQGTNNKATNHIEGSKNTLYSYNTKVAEYDTETQKIEVYGYHSVTTGRHINKFLALFELPKMTKNQLFNQFNLKY